MKQRHNCRVNVQVLGLCLNRGPLCNPLNPVQFFAVFALPITPQAILHGVKLLHYQRICVLTLRRVQQVSPGANGCWRVQLEPTTAPAA